MPSFFVRTPRLVKDQPSLGIITNDVANNQGLGTYSFAMGTGSRTKHTGEFAQSSTRVAGNAEAQFRRILHRGETINSAAFTEIFINGVDEQLFVDRYSTYFFRTLLIGRGYAGVFDGKSKTWLFEGILTKNFEDGAGAAVLTALSKTIIGETDPAIVWDVDGDIGGATNENFRVLVQGDALSSIRWMGSTQIEQISTPP